MASARIENIFDVAARKRGVLPAEKVRTVEVIDAVVDPRDAMLLLPKSMISSLGLIPSRTWQTRGLGSPLTLQMFSAVRLTIQDRECVLDVGAIEDHSPVLIGQIPLEMLDFVVDPKRQRLIGNPEHGGEHIIDVF